jgi:hypothetical protein
VSVLGAYRPAKTPVLGYLDALGQGARVADAEERIAFVDTADVSQAHSEVHVALGLALAWLRQRRGSLIMALLLAALVACGGGSVSGPPTSDIDLTFANGASSLLANTGTDGDEVEVALVMAGSARTKIIEGPDGKGIGLPDFSAAPGSPQTVVRISNAESAGGDRLNPGTGNFSFGADFALDPSPTSQHPSTVDDGDNLMQRGLYGERSQYKIDLDTRSPACYLHGRAGHDGYRGVLDMHTVQDFPAKGVAADTWYRVVCSRTGPSSAELTVVQLSTHGSVVRTWTTTDIEPAMPTGPILDLTPADPGIPLSVGGKLGDQGDLVSGESVDQFNGQVDDVTFALG